MDGTVSINTIYQLLFDIQATARQEEAQIRSLKASLQVEEDKKRLLDEEIASLEKTAAFQEDQLHEVEKEHRVVQRSAELALSITATLDQMTHSQLEREMDSWSALISDSWTSLRQGIWSKIAMLEHNQHMPQNVADVQGEGSMMALDEGDHSVDEVAAQTMQEAPAAAAAAARVGIKKTLFQFR